MSLRTPSRRQGRSSSSSRQGRQIAYGRPYLVIPHRYIEIEIEIEVEVEVEIEIHRHSHSPQGLDHEVEKPQLCFGLLEGVVEILHVRRFWELLHDLPRRLRVEFSEHPLFARHSPSAPCKGLWFRVQGSGFMVQGSGFRIQGSGFRLQTRL